MKAFKWIPPFLGEGRGSLERVPYENLVKVPLEQPGFTEDPTEGLEELLNDKLHACQTGDCDHALEMQCDEALADAQEEVSKAKVMDQFVAAIPAGDPEEYKRHVEREFKKETQ